MAVARLSCTTFALPSSKNSVTAAGQSGETSERKKWSESCSCGAQTVPKTQSGVMTDGHRRAKRVRHDGTQVPSADSPPQSPTPHYEMASCDGWWETCGVCCFWGVCGASYPMGSYMRACTFPDCMRAYGQMTKLVKRRFQ
eukprot:scaffold2850_cov235-Pinguiococcus_pyrenoidosus.AAC.17